MRKLIPVMVTGLIILGMTYFMIHMLNRSIYPGCTVISQSDDILTIKFDKEFYTGTDLSALKAAELILRICKDGYRVQVWGRIINLEEAYELIYYTGGPVPLDYIKNYQEND